MTHCKLGAAIKYKKSPEKLDVAIIGAGMAGLYSAYRLNKKQPDTSFAIFERSERTGGRLDSDLVNFKNPKYNPNDHSDNAEPQYITVKEEQGGMRFLFDGMDDLMALFVELDLVDQIVPFPMNSGGKNRMYFRGTSFSAEEASSDDNSLWSALYNLNPAEQNLNPKDIVTDVFNRILQENPQFDPFPESADKKSKGEAKKGPEFWQRFRNLCNWKGKPLNQWTLWELFNDMGYSNECITMLYRSLGFNGTFLSKMNAGVAYQLLEDFPADVRFRTFLDGFSTLPNKLVESIGEENIHLRSELSELDTLDDGSFKLTIARTNQNGVVETDTVIAKKVILALPRLALEKLFVRSNAFNKLKAFDQEQGESDAQDLWTLLQSASNQPLLKINLYYEKPWWGRDISGRPSIEFGPNFADLPTGSVYPFYAVDEKLAASLMYLERDENPQGKAKIEIDAASESKYEKPAALTIYCDYANINFWSELQKTAGEETFVNPRAKDILESVPSDMAPAADSIVKAATSFFKDIFNTHYVPEPILTSARIWEGNSSTLSYEEGNFGYGVHQWAVGYNDIDVTKQLAKPFKTADLFICGEAFSDYQGWVEGALRSADLVLNYFNIAPISEVVKNPSKTVRKQYNANVDQNIKQQLGVEPPAIIKDSEGDQIPSGKECSVGLTRIIS